MVVKIKRTEAATQQEHDEEQRRKDEMRSLAWQQQAQLRVVARDNLRKLGAGIQRWDEEGWGWQPLVDGRPHDPEEWTGLARVMYRLAQVMIIDRQLGWLAIRKDEPFWCAGCHPGEGRPTGYTDECCPLHNSAHTLAYAVGTALFGEGEA